MVSLNVPLHSDSASKSTEMVDGTPGTFSFEPLASPPCRLDAATVWDKEKSGRAPESYTGRGPGVMGPRPAPSPPAKRARGQLHADRGCRVAWKNQARNTQTRRPARSCGTVPPSSRANGGLDRRPGMLTFSSPMAHGRSRPERGQRRIEPPGDAGQSRRQGPLALRGEHERISVGPSRAAVSSRRARRACWEAQGGMEPQASRLRGAGLGACVAPGTGASRRRRTGLGQPDFDHLRCEAGWTVRTAASKTASKRRRAQEQRDVVEVRADPDPELDEAAARADVKPFCNGHVLGGGIARVVAGDRREKNSAAVGRGVRAIGPGWSRLCAEERRARRPSG